MEFHLEFPASISGHVRHDKAFNGKESRDEFRWITTEWLVKVHQTHCVRQLSIFAVRWWLQFAESSSAARMKLHAKIDAHWMLHNYYPFNRSTELVGTLENYWFYATPANNEKIVCLFMDRARCKVVQPFRSWSESVRWKADETRLIYAFYAFCRTWTKARRRHFQLASVRTLRCISEKIMKFNFGVWLHCRFMVMGPWLLIKTLSDLQMNVKMSFRRK